jgi:Protein of unknown function (DUF1348)
LPSVANRWLLPRLFIFQLGRHDFDSRDSNQVSARRASGPLPTATSPNGLAYQRHDNFEGWFLSCGNENREFLPNGLMQRRLASINDLPIKESERNTVGITSGLAIRTILDFRTSVFDGSLRISGSLTEALLSGEPQNEGKHGKRISSQFSMQSRRPYAASLAQ